MLFYDQSGALSQFQGFNNSTHEYRINNIAAGGSINFMLASASKFKVRSDGNIDIPGTIMKNGNRFIHNFGISNTFIGEAAGNFAMSGGNNTGSGANALFSNTGGILNTATGASALQNNTTGGSNTAIGKDSLLSNMTGSQNTASGNQALQNSGKIVNAGAFDVGRQYTIQTAGNTNFTLIGAANNNVGTVFVASGFGTGTGTASSNTNGNTASGYQALFNNTAGDYNTASGWGALIHNTSGSQNTASGGNALFNNAVGAFNTAIGFAALGSNLIGNNNVAIGTSALSGNIIGNDNVAIGVGAGNQITGDSNIDIGNAGVAGEVGTIRIGTGGTHTLAVISGIYGTTIGGSALTVFIDSNGHLGTIVSSRRFKDDIADMDAASSALMKLRPVTFHYKTDRNPSGRTLQYGLIAEEVAAVYPGLVAHAADGRIEAVMYQFLPPMLLNEYQKQQRMIEAQAARIGALEMQAAEIEMLKQQVALMAQQQAAGMAAGRLEAARLAAAR